MSDRDTSQSDDVPDEQASPDPSATDPSESTAPDTRGADEGVGSGSAPESVTEQTASAAGDVADADADTAGTVGTVGTVDGQTGRTDTVEEATGQVDGVDGGDGGDGGGEEPANATGDDAPPAQASDAATLGPRPWPIGVGIGALVAGVIAMFLLMANSDRVPRGPLWGMIAAAFATFGLLDVLGLFRRTKGAVRWTNTMVGHEPGTPVHRRPLTMFVLAGGLLLAGMLIFGVTTFPAFGLQVPYLTVVILAALAMLLPSARGRPGLLVFIGICAIYFPLLGVPALWDPWETHYGEVAREILSRDDWISLWWAHEKWFWSKPIYIFWAEALSMGALGVDYTPDANPLHPEWAVRLPIAALSVVALMTAYFALKRIFRPRAAAMAVFCLATAPHFFFLAHQAITDMAMVGNVLIAVSLLLLAIREDPERLATRYRIGPFELSLQHLVLALVTLTVLPQVMYFITRNVTWFDSGFAWHRDEFFSGSAGNGGIPGNPPIRDEVPPGILRHWAFQPIVQGSVWLVGLLGIIAMTWRERRAQTLLMFGFYLFCAHAFLGKGIPGFALPGLVALLYLISSGRWSLLLEGRLKILPGSLIVATAGLPWYVAMYMRHGPAFTQRLLIHDHINRLARGVHMDETTPGHFGYYVLQLGFATFPWVGLVPFAVLSFMWLYRRRARQERPAGAGFRGGGPQAPRDPALYHQRQTVLLLALWFFAAFILFSAMATRFHHYIFPAVPPAMLLVGLMLDRMIGHPPPTRRARWGAFCAGLIPLPLALGIGGLYGDLRGEIPPGHEGTDWVLSNGPGAAVCWSLIALGVVLALVAYRLLDNAGSSGAPKKLGARAPVYAIAVAAGACLVALVGRDFSWNTMQRPHGYERLIHLFVYNYNRPWPTQYDYRPLLTGFAIVGTLVFALVAVRRVRRVASRALIGFALVFSAWAVNLYFVDLGEHWGIRPLLLRYYELREGPEEPILAYQMNWKGENFYTGNRVHTFVDLDTTKLREWAAENRGTRIFVMLERSRMPGFRAAIATQNEATEHTDERFCSKFVLVELTL